jgi:hypothetical protein
MHRFRHSIIPTVDPDIQTHDTVRREYSFPKNCKFEYHAAQDKDLGSYQVSLFYHIGLVGNWANIVHDQLDTLEQCGLGYIANDLTITYRNTPHPVDLTVQLLQGMIKQYNFSTSLQTIHFINAGSSYPYEWPIMQEMYQRCTLPDNAKERTVDLWTSSSKEEGRRSSEYPVKDDQTKRIVYYLHNKGSSKYTPSWKPEKHDPYYRVFLWRKYMEWFIHERPTLCLKAILRHGAMTCGVQIKTKPLVHYSGNFWAASCDWIKQLNNQKPTGSRQVRYIGAELWIGNQTMIRNETRVLNLFSIPSPHLYNEPIYLRPFLDSGGAFPERYNLVFANKTSWPKDRTKLWLDYLSGIDSLL